MHSQNGRRKVQEELDSQRTCRTWPRHPSGALGCLVITTEGEKFHPRTWWSRVDWWDVRVDSLEKDCLQLRALDAKRRERESVSSGERKGPRCTQASRDARRRFTEQHTLWSHHPLTLLSPRYDLKVCFGITFKNKPPLRNFPLSEHVEQHSKSHHQSL